VVLGQSSGLRNTPDLFELFEQSQTQTHHHSAFDLTTEGERVDDAADVVGSHDAQYFDLAGLGIDLDLGGLRGKTEGDVGISRLSQAYRRRSRVDSLSC